MHVIADRPQIAVAAAVHDERLVTSTEQVAEEFVATIEPRGVGAQEPAHPGHKIAAGRFDHEMKMILQETIGMHLPVRLGTSLGERGEKAFVIEVVAEDGLAMVATIHDVINRAGIFDAQLARHGNPLPPHRIGVNSKERSL